MDKKEMLTMVLQLVNECKKHSACDECPLGDGSYYCGVSDVDSIELERELAKCEAPNVELMKIDNVNSPAHYCKGGIECIDAIKSATVGLQGVEGYCIGNAIKYLWRWKFKNGVEDLKKARWYINRTIQELEGNNVNS